MNPAAPCAVDTLKHLLQTDTPAFSIFMNTGCPFACEIFAHAGFPIIAVDCQHSVFTEQSALQAFQAIQTTNAIPIARSRWNDPSHIMRLLDFGAMGIICPMINTAEDAKKFVSACRYSPQGNRSFGPIRSAVAYGADYYKTANDAIITLAMIETADSLQNVDDILTVPGLNGIFVGPNDLSIDLGHPPLLDSDHTEFDKIITHIASKAKAQGKITGIFTGTINGAKKRIKQGYNFIILSNDATVLKQQSAKMMADINSV